MANAPSLVALAAAAEVVAHEAKAERAKAMDALIDLLFERAQMRSLMRMAIPILEIAPARSDVMLVPAVIADEMAQMLKSGEETDA